jgi:ligand-binding sensor domain-containing protein
MDNRRANKAKLTPTLKGMSVRTKLRRLIGFILLLALLVPQFARGDQFTELLNGAQITAIVYDARREVVWFGTANRGLIKFDGKNLTPCDAQKSGFACNRIAALALDRDGDLWIGTIGFGVARFKIEQNVWEVYDTRNGLVHNNVRSIAAGPDGKVWFGTEISVGLFDGRQWYRYTTTHHARWDTMAMQWETLRTYAANEKRLSHDLVLAVAVDGPDKVWFGTRADISVLKGGCEWDTVSVGRKQVQAILVDRKGRKWFGTQANGVYKLSADDKTFELTPSRFPACVQGEIKAIFNDDDGNIWFGTDDGAPRLDPISMTWRCATGNADFDRKQIQAIAADEDGNLWFGSFASEDVTKYAANWFSFSATTDSGLQKLRIVDIYAMARDSTDQVWIGTGGGIARYDSAGWKSKAILPNPFDQGNRVNAIGVTMDNTVWLCTRGVGVIRVDSLGNLIERLTVTESGGKLLNDVVLAIAIDKINKQIWFGTRNEGLSRLHLDDSNKPVWETPIPIQEVLCGNQVKTDINAIAIDKQGRVWCGTPRGVSVYDGNTWQCFTPVSTNGGLLEDNISSIRVDQNSGRVWIGTSGGGASSYFNGKWDRKVNTTNGLPDDFVQDILVFGDPAEVWFATSGGVSCLNAAGALTTYKISDGLIDNEVTRLIDVPRRREIWFGTAQDGVTRYRRPQKAPNTQILNEFDVVTQTELIYRFSGNDLNTSDRLLRYSYKLAPEDTAWSPYTSDDFARIKITRNGPHTFYVKAIDKDKHEDPSPATDFFYKITPDTGSFTSSTDKSGVHKLDSVKITLYWPPYQLADTMKVTITPVHPDSLQNKPAVLAYDFTPYQTDIRKKGVILSFEFPGAADQIYSIQRERDGNGRPNFAVLGGTQAIAKGRVTLTTAIDQFGRYAVRVKESVADSSGALAVVKVNAQPRIFSPAGGGHGLQTTVSFKLDRDAPVRLQVYNLAGRLVKTIWNEPMRAGVNAVAWDGRDSHGEVCPTGLYIITLESNGFQAPPKPAKVMVMN